VVVNIIDCDNQTMSSSDKSKTCRRPKFQEKTVESPVTEEKRSDSKGITLDLLSWSARNSENRLQLLEDSYSLLSPYQKMTFKNLLDEYKECVENFDRQHSKNTEGDWSEILPHIILGDINTAMSSKTLKYLGITHVVSLVPKNIILPIDLPHKMIKVRDSPETNLTSKFRKTHNWMKEAQNADPKAVILVHCMMGISRSSTIVISYLMKMNKWSFQKAYDFVKSKRSIISPNAGFTNQLIEYEAYLKLNRIIKCGVCTDVVVRYCY
jgi:predicted protein tyrosine phosphatase